MEALIYKISELLAEVFWKYLRPRREASYVFRQEGGVLVRVVVEVVREEEAIELGRDVYYQVVA